MGRQEEADQLQTDTFAAGDELRATMTTHAEAVFRTLDPQIQESWMRLIASITNFLEIDSKFLRFLLNNTDIREIEK